MNALVALALLLVAADPVEKGQTPEDWRAAEQAWRERFQAAHKDYQARPPEPAPAVELTPLPPQPHPKRRYAIIRTVFGYQVVRVENGRMMALAPAWDSRQAADYAIRDLKQLDQTDPDAAPPGRVIATRRQPHHHPARMANSGRKSKSSLKRAPLHHDGASTTSGAG